VTDGSGDINVKSRGAPPQMFRDGMGVVVEGRYMTNGVFDCKNLMVKHSNEYRPPKPGETPQAMYKTLMKGAGLVNGVVGRGALLIALPFIVLGNLFGPVWCVRGGERNG